MDGIKKGLTIDEFNAIVIEKGFNKELLQKDYFVTVLLYLIKDIDGIFFKGGTALNKIFLEHSRLSEDIDFTLTRKLEDAKKEIEIKINNSRLFGKITYDKTVQGFIRLIVPYKGFAGEDSTVFIDLNARGKLLTKPDVNYIEHFYPNIPKFSFPTLSQEEMIAEKVAATIGRNKPRDHFDVYQIMKRNIPINIDLVKKKCKDSGDEFSIIKMFNHGQKLHKRWQEDLAPLLVQETSFKEIMTFLAKHFKLKEEKETLKKK